MWGEIALIHNALLPIHSSPVLLQIALAKDTLPVSINRIGVHNCISRSHNEQIALLDCQPKIEPPSIFLRGKGDSIWSTCSVTTSPTVTQLLVNLNLIVLIVPPKSKTTDREIVRSLSPEHMFRERNCEKVSS